MESPSPSNPSPSPSPDGTFSTDRFEQAAAIIPDVIVGDAGAAGAAAGPGVAPAPAPAPGWPEQLVRGAFDLPTAFLAGRLGDYWRLSTAELDALVLTAKPVLDEWLPFDKLGNAGALLMTLTVVFGPRLAQLQLERKAAAATPSTATAASAA